MVTKQNSFSVINSFLAAAQQFLGSRAQGKLWAQAAAAALAFEMKTNDT